MGMGVLGLGTVSGSAATPGMRSIPPVLLWGLLGPPEQHPEGKGCRQEVTSRH